MTLPFNTASDFRVVPYFADVDLAPRLVPVDQARPGDLVAMVSYLKLDAYSCPSHDHGLEVFYVQGETGLETRSYQDLAGDAADYAAHLVAEALFMGSDPDKVVSDCEMVESIEGYELHIVHFADAVLYITPEWLHGDLDEEEHEHLHPVVVRMGEVGDRASAKDCVARTRRYLDVIRSMLPAHLRDEADWSIRMPAPEMFLAEKLRSTR